MAKFLSTTLAGALNLDVSSTLNLLPLYRILAVIARELCSSQASIHTAAIKVQTMLSGQAATDEVLTLEYYQCIFVFVSWLTMLYVAADNPQPGMFQLQLPGSETARRAGSRIPQSITWHHLRCDIIESRENMAYLSIQHLMYQFGNFVPPPCRQLNKPARDLYEDYIISTNLDYHTLSKVGHISIEWVDALSLHLEFHERSSVLRMFPFPSFCALLTQSETQTTFLSK